MEYDKELEERTGIFLFENAFSKELCEETIKEFEKSKDKFHGQTGGGYRPGHKKSTDVHLQNENFTKKYFTILEIAMNQISKKYYNIKRFPIEWTGLQIQKSIKGEGYFKPHCDNDESDLVRARWFAPILYLNDVLEGGETLFPFQKYKLKPTAGTLVIFPATWRYWHEGVKPMSNDKYIITTFGSVPRQ